MVHDLDVFQPSSPRRNHGCKGVGTRAYWASYLLTSSLLAFMWKVWRFYLNLVNSLETSLHTEFLSNVPLSGCAGVHELDLRGSKQSCPYLWLLTDVQTICFAVSLSSFQHQMMTWPSSWENWTSKKWYSSGPGQCQPQIQYFKSLQQSTSKLRLMKNIILQERNAIHSYF